LVIADRPAGSPERVGPQRLPELTTVRILAVDDDVRDLSARALRRRGYTVFEAASGEVAMDWWLRSRVRPDLLVTDIVMPGISGPDLARRLTEYHPALRVLFISGYTDSADEAHGPYLAGVPFLQKPFTSRMLAERVRLVLDTSKA